MRAVLRTAVVLVLGAGLVIGAVRLPDLHARLAGSGDGSTAQAAETAAARPVSRSTVVCPGPESVGVKRVDSSVASAPTTISMSSPPTDVLGSALSAAHVVTSGGAAAGQVDAAALGGSGPLDVAPLSTAGSGSTQTTQPRSVVVSGVASLAPGLAAAQVTLLTAGDLRGLSTVACQQPSAQTWLVGGAGTTGHRGRVILTNPTPNPVTVNLSVFGAKGPVTTTAARGIVVKAHRRVVVLLQALAPGEASPVVHVQASGGVISAVLNDTWLDQTTPAGADDAVGTMPGTHLVVPGVLGSATPGNVILRVAATSQPATVQLRVLGAAGPTAAPVDNGQVQVPANTTRDIALTGLPAGYNGLELTATAPVVAGVQLRTGLPTAGTKRDLAWTAAEPVLRGLAGVPLGPVAAPWAHALALTAASEDSVVDVDFVAADGSRATQQVTVSAGTTVTIPVPVTVPGGAGSTTGTPNPPVGLWLRPSSGAVSAALGTAYTDPAGMLLSVTPLVATPLTFTPVAVHPLGG